MFKIIEKIGGRKVFIFILSISALTSGFFVITDRSSYKVFCGSVVAVLTMFNAGNVFEHKYNEKNGEEI